MKIFGSDSPEDNLFPNFNCAQSFGHSLENIEFSREFELLVKALESIITAPSIDQFSPKSFLESSKVIVNKLSVGRHPDSRAISYSLVAKKLGLFSSVTGTELDRQARISELVHEYLLFVTSNCDLREEEVSEQFIFSSKIRDSVKSSILEKGIVLESLSQDERGIIKNLVLSVFRSLKILSYDQIKNTQGMQIEMISRSASSHLGLLYSLPDSFGQGWGGNYLVDFKKRFDPSSINLSLQFGMYALVSDLVGRRIDRLVVIEMSEREGETGEIHYLTKMNLALFLRFILIYLDLMPRVTLKKKGNKKEKSIFRQQSLNFEEEIPEHKYLILLRQMLREFHNTCEWEKLEN